MTIGAFQADEVVAISEISPEGLAISPTRIYVGITRYEFDFSGETTRTEESKLGIIGYDRAGVEVSRWPDLRTSIRNSSFRGKTINVYPYGFLRDIALYDSHIYVLYNGGFNDETYSRNPANPVGHIVDRYNLSGQFLGNIITTTDINATGIAVTSSRIFLADIVATDSTHTAHIRAFDHSGARQASEDFATRQPSALISNFRLTATESRIIILDPGSGNSSSEVYVYTHGGELKPGEGARTRTSVSEGIDVTSTRLYIVGEVESEVRPYIYTPTSDGDFVDEGMTRKDFVPGDDVIFKITSTPAPTQPIEVMYIISSGGNIIDSDENGAKVISIEAEETTITIPTRSSGVEDGYFVAIRLTQGSGYQLGPPDQISDRVGEEAT